MNNRDDYGFEELDIDPISKEILRKMRRGEKIEEDSRSLEEKIKATEEILKNTSDDYPRLKEGVRKHLEKLKEERD